MQGEYVYPRWICDAEKMALTGDALFVYLTRVDRGHEVSDGLASGERPIMYDRMR